MNQDDWNPGGRPKHVPGLSLYDSHICGSIGNCLLLPTFLENESRFDWIGPLLIDNSTN